MSSRTCPDWPRLMEVAPDLQFMHYTVAEAKLPADALAGLSNVSLNEVAICCDLDRHVFNLGHGVLPETDPADLSRLVELVHERTATVAV